MAVAAAVAAWVVLHWVTVEAGSDTLAAADLEWLGLALALTTVLWLAGTATLLGSLSVRPPLAQMFGVQVSASVVNHVVPGGIGGMAVNVRFLQRSGLTRPAAVAAVGLNSVATLVTHLCLIVSVWALAPTVLPSVGVHAQVVRLAKVLGLGTSSESALWKDALVVAGGTTLLVVLTGAVVANRPGRRGGAWRRCRDAVTGATRHGLQELATLQLVMRSPGRALLLWGGSAASPLLHAIILAAVFKSLASGVPAVTIALVYLVASALAALVPSPGGFGSLDVALVAGLIAAGAPSPTAVAVVLGYRLVTVWVPLVPGTLVLAVLLRRRLL